MTPDPDRAQAEAADGGVSAWVGASAGTGKTKVLTDRVLTLLLGGSAPSRILCLTFTRAAAAEMANRLGERLAEWAVAEDGALRQAIGKLLKRAPDERDLALARQLFARVLDAPGGLKIETIHAFCQSLLRRFPIEAGIAPHFELMDERNATEALAAARDQMLAEARIGANADLAAALATVTERAAEETFDKLMAELITERARLATAFADGEDRFHARLCAALGCARDATPDAIIAAAGASGVCDEDALRRAADLMIANGSVTDRLAGGRIAAWLAAGDRTAEYREYVLAYLTQTGERRAILATKEPAALDPTLLPTLQAEAARIEAVERRRATAALMCATRALAALGDRMLALYRRYKEARALLDYDDLILGACRLLRGGGVPEWVLFKLDGGIDHILIDEAQDTNPEQWEVVRKLADEFFAGVSARELRRTIFAVGDPKQSIFSFQRADPTQFLAMRRHFEQRVQEARENFRPVSLDVSFRSTEAVLAAVDATFARAEAADGVALDDAPIRHHAHRAGQAGLVELWPPVAPVEPTPPAAWDPPTEQRPASQAELRLAQAIAETVRGWIASGERLEARDRRIRPGDILVLVRRRTPFVAALVRALKERQVEVAGTDRMRLVDQLAVEDLMALLQILLLPEDDLTLAAVLKGPLFGLDDELLFALANPRGAGVPLWTELRRRAGEHAAFAQAAAMLGELMARADFVPPYELLAEILGERGGRRRFRARLGPECEDALDELLAAALAYERRHGPSLQGFLHWLAAGEIDVKRDLDERGRDEVRIMTVHGAKGLEAPIVFLADTLGMPTQPLQLVWSEAGLPLWKAHPGCGAAAYDLARAAAKERREQEYRRLLYVAMTRAEDRLYVCGWLGKKSPPAGNWHALVKAGLASAAGCERFQYTAPSADGWLGEGLRLVTPQRAAPKSDDRSTHAAQLATLPDWAKTPPRPEPIPPRPLAPSQPEGTEPAPRSPLGADQGAGFRRGLLVHRLLQGLPQLEPAARAAAARRFLARPVHALAPAEQEALLTETMAVLEHPDFAPLFGEGALAEVPVVGLVEGRAISGRIDRLVVQDGSVLIVDYKTLRPVPASAADIPALYIEQLKAYRAAVASVYPGRRVRCALLWTDGPSLMEIDPARLAIDARRVAS